MDLLQLNSKFLQEIQIKAMNKESREIKEKSFDDICKINPELTNTKEQFFLLYSMVIDLYQRVLLANNEVELRSVDPLKHYEENVRPVLDYLQIEHDKKNADYSYVDLGETFVGFGWQEPVTHKNFETFRWMSGYRALVAIPMLSNEKNVLLSICTNSPQYLEQVSFLVNGDLARIKVVESKNTDHKICIFMEDLPGQNIISAVGHAVHFLEIVENADEDVEGTTASFPHNLGVGEIVIQ